MAPGAIADAVTALGASPAAPTDPAFSEAAVTESFASALAVTAPEPSALEGTAPFASARAVTAPLARSDLVTLWPVPAKAPVLPATATIRARRPRTVPGEGRFSFGRFISFLLERSGFESSLGAELVKARPDRRL